MTTSMNALNRYKFTLKFDICPDRSDLIQWLKSNCKKWVFQHEKGDSGYEHYGGRFSLRKKRRKSELVNLLQKSEILKVMWVAPEVTTNNDDFYDTKEDTKIDGPWCDTDIEMYIPRQCREIMDNLRPWQQYIKDDIGKWDTRTINMIYDPKGNIGKSTFCTYLSAAGLGRQLPSVNDYKDLLGVVCDLPTSKMYLIDMPRAIKKDKLGGLYSAIESIKNGYAFDTRYQFKEKFFDCPSIWVFSNILPDFEMLSIDRWQIWQVDMRDWYLKSYKGKIQ